MVPGFPRQLGPFGGLGELIPATLIAKVDPHLRICYSSDDERRNRNQVVLWFWALTSTGSQDEGSSAKRRNNCSVASDFLDKVNKEASLSSQQDICSTPSIISVANHLVICLILFFGCYCCCLLPIHAVYNYLTSSICKSQI